MSFRLPCWLAAVLVGLPPVPVVAAPTDDREVERLVRQLGSDSFADRERASRRLEAIGEPARPALRAAAVSPDAEVRTRGGRLLLALNARLQVLCFQGHAAAVVGVAFTPDGRRLASASTDGTVHLIDLVTGQPIHRMEHPSALSVAVSPDGTRAVSTGLGDKQALRVWDLRTGKELGRFTGYQHGAYRAVFGPDGTEVLVGAYDDRPVRWLDLASGREPRRLAGPTGPVSGVALSADGKTVLSGGDDAAVRVWDAATGKERMRLEGHTGYVWSVAVSPDGKRAASGGTDQTIRVWDLETAKEVRQMRAPSLRVRRLAFSGDGRHLVSANFDHHSVSLWDPGTGRELHRFDGHADEVYDVAISSDGRSVASAGRDKTVRVWRLPYDR